MNKSVRLWCLMLLILAMGAMAEESQPGPAEPPKHVETGATLTFANRPIVVFRSTFAGYSPADRAEGALKRIEAAVAKGGSGNVDPPNR
jgi:hypothetical protein